MRLLLHTVMLLASLAAARRVVGGRGVAGAVGAALLAPRHAAAAIRVLPSGLQAPVARQMSGASAAAAGGPAPPPPPPPGTMPAVVAEGARCVVATRDVPTPRAGELLLRVAYTAVNRADTLQRKGQYAPPPGASDVLGLEAVGEVVGAGPAEGAPREDAAALPRFPPGTRAMALLGGGGYAGYVAVPASHVLAVPDGMPTRTAAAIPETWLTAYQLLFLVGHAQRGQTVLVHAAGSGVGTAAVQLAARAGLRVLAVAGSDGKLAVARRLGAAEGINYK
jgi:NADPH:quinone reductase-like Zn-dependent oxidoreductase